MCEPSDLTLAPVSPLARERREYNARSSRQRVTGFF
jgi:hypothetical protein